jgi:hypothetical protein
MVRQRCASGGRFEPNDMYEAVYPAAPIHPMITSLTPQLREHTIRELYGYVCVGFWIWASEDASSTHSGE